MKILKNLQLTTVAAADEILAAAATNVQSCENFTSRDALTDFRNDCFYSHLLLDLWRSCRLSFPAIEIQCSKVGVADRLGADDLCLGSHHMIWEQ